MDARVTQWPPDVVRVSETPAGLRLQYPVLREWRPALRLACGCGAMFVLALYAALAYSPEAAPGGAAALTLVLTAVVVYPVILFGALFVLLALFTVATSLTVEVDAACITSVRRLFGVAYSRRSLPTAAIVAFEPEAVRLARGLGGAVHYRLMATPAGAPKLAVGDRIPDESLCRRVQGLIETHAYKARAGG